MPIRNALRESSYTTDLMLGEVLAIPACERQNEAGPMDGDTTLIATASARLSADDRGSGIADGDWDDLFNAVQDQLTHLVSDGAFGSATHIALGAAQIRDGVLDCVAALRLLQDTVDARRVQRDGLALAVFDAQTSLAQVRAALFGTQHGGRRARHDALHDRLTGLPNREFLHDRINRQLATAAQARWVFAVMFFDLDGFKQVNDAHGQAAGDELLRIIGARLRRVVRAQDVVGRVGGDEFACLIGGIGDRAQLAHLAGKIGQAVSAPCTVGGLKLVVHASIGIATSPDAGNSADTLLKSADRAMSAAKRQQTTHAFFSRDDAAATAAQPDPA